MATEKTKKTTPASSRIKISLTSLRLKKLFIEVLIPPDDAGKGRIEMSYNIATPPIDSTGAHVAVLNIIGKGVNKDDTSKVSFTIDAEMLGMFDISRNPKKNEESALAISMANLIIPTLTDIIETTLFQSGFPRVNMQKGFPEES